MANNLCFDFKSDISNIEIPKELNNPFSSSVPEICKIAVREFQEFITTESPKWNYDFRTRKGKMFGVLVIQDNNKKYRYLGAVSGKIDRKVDCKELAPSVFDVSTDSFFINRGMTELTVLCNKINTLEDKSVRNKLKEERRIKSTALQQKLFENYYFSNKSGQAINLIEIFSNALNKLPPSAAGECAAPKLLQYAYNQNLKPIAWTEFWWSHSDNKSEKQHKAFFPACKDRCRYILEYMLEDDSLYNNRKVVNK